MSERVGNQIVGAIANAQLFAEHQRLEKERMSLQEQLQQSQKREAIGRLAGGVAHGFNNLLTVIQDNCELSLLKFREEDPLRENVESVKKTAQKASNLTSQLLAFSCRQILELQVVNFNKILTDLEKYCGG